MDLDAHPFVLAVRGMARDVVEGAYRDAAQAERWRVEVETASLERLREISAALDGFFTIYGPNGGAAGVASWYASFKGSVYQAALRVGGPKQDAVNALGWRPMV